MRTVFADTFYFIALLNRADAAHAKAVAFTSSQAARMVTTGWVLTELADGLAPSRQGRAEFLSLLTDLRADPAMTIVACRTATSRPGTVESLSDDRKTSPETAPRKRSRSYAQGPCANVNMLGSSLLGQKKYAEAEPLLQEGYEGM
jgi:hypothetical protein